MQKIRINNLSPGQRFPQHLFSLTGQKLLNAGTELNARHIQAMRRFGDTEVIQARSVEELVEAGMIERFDSSKLAVGQRAAHGVLSVGGQVLIEPDQEVEQHHLEALRSTGAAYVSRGNTSHEQRRERILLADVLMDELDHAVVGLNLRISAQAGTFFQPADPRAWPSTAELARWRNQGVETLREAFARIEAGVTVPITHFDPLLNDLLERLTHHPSCFTQLALLCPRREDYLPDHAYTTTVLAMAIGAQLHWSPAHVRQLGLAAILSDLGMLLVPERIRTGACELTDVDRARVNRHPVFSLAMLQVVENVPTLVRLAAVQHHERENGSGYPRGLRRDAICDFARVLGVADSFAATTEPRHYRKPKLPYIAMEEMVRSAGAMAFWKPAARALVQAAGLFPVGSYVKLSDGSNAHVITANFTRLDRPTVQPLDALGQPKGPPIDLATVPPDQLSVVRPLPSAVG